MEEDDFRHANRVIILPIIYTSAIVENVVFQQVKRHNLGPAVNRETT